MSHLDANGDPVLPVETDPVRKAVVDAMRRMFSGQPRIVEPGRLSIVALGDEAEVSRNALNRKYDDLRDLFTDILRELNEVEWAKPVSAEKHAELMDQLTEKEELLKEIRDKQSRWREAAEVFIRKNQVLQIELAEAERRTDNLQRRLERTERELDGYKQAAHEAAKVVPFQSRD